MRHYEVQWGPDCARHGCGHPKLVHRGPAHDGNCAAVRCAIATDGWDYRSKCEAYLAPTPEQQGAPESASAPDDDQPFDRTREKTPEVPW